MTQHIDSDTPFSWLSTYTGKEGITDSIYVSTPSSILIVQIFVSPSYTINKVNKRRVLLDDNGFPNSEYTPDRLRSQEGNYRLACSFRYSTSVTNENEIESDDIGSIEELETNKYGSWPPSISGLHSLNTLYLIYQQTNLRRPNDAAPKTRKHVRFANSKNNKKTRRV